MTKPVFIVAPDEAGWVAACCAPIVQELQTALSEDRGALLAVAGGSTPAPIFRDLARTPLDWPRVAVTLVDERRVPPTSPDSNERLVRETLLRDAAALAGFAAMLEGPIGRLPDAALLGMGDDGHFASIFPGNPLEAELLDLHHAPAVLAVPAGEGRAPAQPRLSLNLSALLGISTLVLAIRGEAKQRVFEQAARGEASHLPIAALLEARPDMQTIWTEHK